MKFQKPIKVVIYLLVFLGTVLFAQDKKIYILHTNNTNGALENCYCPDRPYGSVEKRSVYVSNFFKKHPNSILVDAGDIFTMAHRSYKDSLMAEAYKLLPYDAILYGDQELTMDSKTLDNLTDQMAVSVVSTNLKRKGVVPSKIINREGVKVAVLGVMDEYAVKYYPKEIKEKIELLNPVESIKNEMDRLSNKADIFVLLSHNGFDIDQSIAQEIDGLDVIVGSHSQSSIESPEEVNGTLIVQAGKAGYYIGVVDISMKDGKVVEKTGKIDTMKFEMPDDPRIMKLIEEYEQTTGRMNRNKQKMMKAKN
ncbi:MAG: hypothetical protein VX932_02530 [Candidatus Neomarinimicrobiota bacterium]|nr:hypothetical protein [Candidatus Neomarinimicrobiota bacterium]